MLLWRRFPLGDDFPANPVPGDASSGRLRVVGDRRVTMDSNVISSRWRGRASILFGLALLVLQILGAAGAARAQPRVPLIVFLQQGTESLAGLRSDQLREGLRELGYIEGAQYRMEVRLSDNRLDQLPALARELLRLNPAVAIGSPGVAAAAFWRESKSIPIVLAGGVVIPGMIATLARPGGNVTGIVNQADEVTPKLFEFMREVAPRAERVVTLTSGRGLIEAEVRDLSRIAAKVYGMTLIEAIANSPGEIDQLAARCERERCQALVVLPDPVIFSSLPEQVSALAMRLRLPVVSGNPGYARDWGLIGFATDPGGITRRAAYYVDRILKGALPADLPVEQPTKFELVVNLRTAKALGITVPQLILLRADEIVE